MPSVACAGGGRGRGVGRRRLRRRRRDLRARARSGARALPAAAGARHRRHRRPISGSSWRSALGARTEEEPITGALEGLGCYRPPGRSDPARLPRLRAELAPQARSLAPVGRRSSSSRSSSSAPTGARSSGGCPRGLPGADLRHEHETARPQGLRVHVGGPPRLRGRSAHRTCSSTTRDSSSRAATDWPTSSRSPALQEPGLCAGSRARPAGGYCDRATDDRDFQHAADAGGVLLRPPLRADGRPALGSCPRR